MEDFLKFLLIAGVILVGIFKEVNKNSKSKKAKNKRPVSPMPSPVEVAPDAVPMPEAWGGLVGRFPPQPLLPKLMDAFVREGLRMFLFLGLKYRGVPVRSVRLA